MPSPEQHRKSPLLFVFLVLMVAAILTMQVAWALRQDPLPFSLGLLTLVNAAVWLFVLTWAIYHLVFRIGALLAGAAEPLPADAPTTAFFTILYVTRHDFSKSSLQTCLKQNYPQESFRVMVCDDGNDDSLGRAPDLKDLLAVHANADYVHRATRRGFKAGNVNDALAGLPAGENEWVVIVDADGLLPDNYLATANRIIGHVDERIGFVQGCTYGAEEFHGAAGELVPKTSGFQRVMTNEAAIFWQRDMALRPRFGFVPFLGRGGAIRRSTLDRTHGLPELVSEDLAFAMTACNAGRRGAWSQRLCYFEPFPSDFGAFLIHMKKTAAGAAELVRVCLWSLIRGGAKFVEWFDVLMWLCGYLVPPLVAANLFLSTYVTAALMEREVSILHPWLAYLFIGMTLLSIPSIVSVATSVFRGALYPFLATTVYAAAVPVVAWQFLVHLFKQPVFLVTPKDSSPRARPQPAEVAGTLLLGIALLAVAFWCWSAFSWIALSYASAWVLLPLWYALNDDGWLGRTARVAAAFPLIFFVIGLFQMWKWSLV